MTGDNTAARAEQSPELRKDIEEVRASVGLEDRERAWVGFGRYLIVRAAVPRA